MGTLRTNAYASLAKVVFASPCRLLASACCPDKDLVVLVTRLGALDRLSLWKIQGTKNWEVDISVDDSSSEHIVDVTWSPDGMFSGVSVQTDASSTKGQSIAVVHNPPSITLHSVQDGREERVLPLANPDHSFKLTNIWWFRHEKIQVQTSIPDIFKRNDLIVSPSTNCVCWRFLTIDRRVLHIPFLKIFPSSTVFKMIHRSWRLYST